MNHLQTININGKTDKKVELHQGDLTELTQEESFDLLVISAFPNDYIPTPTSLVGSLFKKRLSVADLATDKELDLRANFSCWLSRDFEPPSIGIQFRRILCFEPLVRGYPPELVGDIFRSLAPVLGDNPKIKTIAMPLVAAGDQGYTVREMLEPLLDAAVHWLEHGLPLNTIKIVAYSESQSQEAEKIFSSKKASYETPIPSEKSNNRASTFEYDVFISYAHENTSEMELFEKELLKASPNIKVFLDRKDINIGTPWQPQIFESLDRCQKVVVFFSPAYLASKVCKEEFNIAWVRSREIEEEIIFPLYLYSASLPTYMKYRNYFDCREGNQTKIMEASIRLVSDLN